MSNVKFKFCSQLLLEDITFAWKKFHHHRIMEVNLALFYLRAISYATISGQEHFQKDDKTKSYADHGISNVINNFLMRIQQEVDNVDEAYIKNGTGFPSHENYNYEILNVELSKFREFVKRLTFFKKAEQDAEDNLGMLVAMYEIEITKT